MELLAVRRGPQMFAVVQIVRDHGDDPFTQRANRTELDEVDGGKLLAQTVFGHGVSYMEREIRWHYLPMDDAQYATALSELGALEAGRAAA